jgi:signal transduction histidine kinase
MTLATRRAAVLTRVLTDSVASVPLFPEPPAPGPAAAPADPLDSRDPVALARLRDDPQAGLSPAGLPRRVLAALRLRELDPAAQPLGELVELLSRGAPSLLSEPVLSELAAQEPALASPAFARWQQEEQVRSCWRQAGGARWLAAGDGAWWFAATPDELRYLEPRSLVDALAAVRADLPRWAALELRGLGLPVREEPASETLATVPLAFVGGLQLEVRGISAAIERDLRRQAAWMLGILGVAVAVSALALALIHRVVRRERRLGELKSQFVSSVSHEFRAPVGSIRLMAEALHEGKISGEPAREFHRLIAGEAARLSHLVENVLDFARIEEGRKRYRFEESDLTRLVADAIALMAPLAAERGVKLRQRLDECSATVDAAAIHQAVVNLLDNAIKFSPRNGTVEIVLALAARNHWQVAIRDEGPGIPSAEQERIFERFHRLGDELRRETQGTGIGLSIVRHTAEAHDGQVRVASSPGQGSVFTLRAPLGRSPTEPPAPAGPAGAEPDIPHTA